MTHFEDRRQEREARTETTIPLAVRESCACPKCSRRMAVTVVVDRPHAVQCPHCLYRFELIIESGKAVS